VSKFSDAAFAIMHRRREASISSADLWKAMREAEPELTATTPTRKTPRTTAMRDIRKDARFVVQGGRIELAKLGSGR
jgi:hypothetical protein